MSRIEIATIIKLSTMASANLVIKIFSDTREGVRLSHFYVRAWQQQ